MRNKSGLNERLVLHFLSSKSAFISPVVRSYIFLIVDALEQNEQKLKANMNYRLSFPAFMVS